MKTIKYVSVAEMVSIEHEANRRGITYDQMMENAGQGLADVIDDQYEHLREDGIVGLVGSGNNGGDTLVALSYLADWGWDPKVYIVRPRDEGDPLVARFLRSGGEIISLTEDQNLNALKEWLYRNAILLDGVLGTGIHLPLRGKIGEVLARTKRILEEMEEPPRVVAVDCPSGIDCDSGEAAQECIPAELTVTMAAYKQGLLRFPAYDFVGKIELVDIGLPDDIQAWQSVQREIATADYVRTNLPKRPLDAHKGTFGTALIVGGSQNFTGAPLLAGEAAHRIGAGLVTIAVPELIHDALAGHFPEGTWLVLPHQNGAISEEAAGEVLDNLDRATAMLIGPGFGLASTTQEFLRKLISGQTSGSQAGTAKIKTQLPSLVIDADGLKLLAIIPKWHELIPQKSILTPHPGEMSIMTGWQVSDIQADRVGTAERFAKEWGHIVILKGAFTVVAEPGGQTAIIPVASPSLARAGTGDVLAGLIVGLRAQGVEAFSAAVVGAWMHAHGGLHAEAILGSSASVLAGDVLQGVVNVMSEF